MRTRGGGGQKKSQNFGDVIYGWPLTENQFSGKTYFYTIAPRESGVKDYIGMFAVSAGFGCEEICKRFSEANNDDYRVVQQDCT